MVKSFSFNFAEISEKKETVISHVRKARSSTSNHIRAQMMGKDKRNKENEEDEQRLTVEREKKQARFEDPTEGK